MHCPQLYAYAHSDAGGIFPPGRSTDPFQELIFWGHTCECRPVKNPLLLLPEELFFVSHSVTKRTRGLDKALVSRGRDEYPLGYSQSQKAPDECRYIRSANGSGAVTLAGLIADHVDRTLTKHKLGTFRRSQAQALTKQAADMRGRADSNG